MIGTIAVVLLLVTAATGFYVWGASRGDPGLRADFLSRLTTGALVAFAIFAVQYYAEQKRDQRAKKQDLEVTIGGERDLSGIGLADRNLTGFHLRGKEFNDADLHGSRLDRAVLANASLQRADLHGASLRSADLENAQLQGAQLVGADLRGANLRGANLFGSSLEKAQLEGADLFGANLRAADLAQASTAGAIFTNSFLQAASLGDAKQLMQARLGGAEYDFLTIWPARYHRHARLQQCIVARSCRVPSSDLLGYFRVRLREGLPKVWSNGSTKNQIKFVSDDREAVVLGNSYRSSLSARRYAVLAGKKGTGGIAEEPGYRNVALTPVELRGGGLSYRRLFTIQSPGEQRQGAIQLYYPDGGRI